MEKQRQIVAKGRRQIGKGGQKQPLKYEADVPMERSSIDPPFAE